MELILVLVQNRNELLCLTPRGQLFLCYVGDQSQYCHQVPLRPPRKLALLLPFILSVQYLDVMMLAIPW